MEKNAETIIVGFWQEINSDGSENQHPSLKYMEFAILNEQ